jgi:hypothetical protein
MIGSGLAGRSLTVAAVGAADRARATMLRALCAVRPLRAFAVDRRRRLMAMQVGMVLFAAGLALRFPLISLWLGAALFGVPHVVAGFRAVTLHRRATRVTLACAALGGLVGVSQLLGVGDGATRAFVALFAVSLGAEILAARRAAALTTATLAALLLAAGAAWTAPRLALVLFSHLHALGALLFFAVEARRRRLPVWPLAWGAGAFTVAAATGLLDGAMSTTWLAPRGAGPSIVAEALGTGFRGSPLGVGASPALFHRALFLYAFGQSLHFATWLRLVPELDRRAPAPKPLRRALAELRADFGRLTTPLLWLTAAAIVLIFLGGGVARDAYFALTYFHVGLEAAALARAGLARGGQPQAIGSLPAEHPRPVSDQRPPSSPSLVEVAA